MLRRGQKLVRFHATGVCSLRLTNIVRSRGSFVVIDILSLLLYLPLLLSRLLQLFIIATNAIIMIIVTIARTNERGMIEIE